MSEDQLQPEDTLDDRGVDDVLDEGISPPERLRGSTAKATTPRGEREGETIDDRLAQEEPEVWDEDTEPEAPAHMDGDAEAVVDDPGELDPPQTGDERTGRIAAQEAPEGAPEQDLFAEDEGIDGAGASAEEAAMHTLDDEGP